ncbi:MAG: aspartate kinase [Candidatus Eisenbacteria bacterium]|uniref:Aspartokinase n=1 Tax=Eiseniibacteriota bacterium TaxID=2212470 RepID=A0A948RW77_UNCEI|nr:aspartate kinase [Candidatus Eisenbacteria bacterium]MBU1947996.1 aspartate kinase [Candidatus Eisenbacteria bacterium]MBU2690647.1 aspartate kinase [Candidatus Eisenbacteria bacterium]
MALRIHKYGGTSVDGPDRLRSVARRLSADVGAGHRVLVVVSAAGHTTDQLVTMAREFCSKPPRRELDMLVTAGERITMALLAMALHELGIPAISFTGSQSGIITDTLHQDARIRTIRPFRILHELNRGRVVIVAGFQGVSEAKEITTLGRGGSDTTAVALAIIFGAPWCGIYTDVPGILTADPRFLPHGRPLKRISHDAAAVLSHLGAGVLSHRAAALARKFGIPLKVARSDAEDEGTWVLPNHMKEPPQGTESVELTMREVDPMESAKILSIALARPVWKLTIEQTIDAILSPAVPLEDLGRPLILHEEGTATGHSRHLIFEGDPPAGLPEGMAARGALALLSLVGEGTMVDPAVVDKARDALAHHQCRILGVYAQGLALSFLINKDESDAAIKVMHKTFIESV